jgi:beta-glucanase (GH16 family)
MLPIIPAIKAQEFFDDFNATSLNPNNWNVANQVWGNVSGRRSNGGVVPQNVRLENGNLVIEAHGNNYTGPVQGHGQNIRVGGAISTVRQFASGKFEVRAKICPHPGALSAFWTYYNENDNYNHEIDFEFPGRNQEPNNPSTSSLEWGLTTSWRGVNSNQHKTHDMYFGNQIDRNYHLYRFEWHTGGNGQVARVEWYYDNVLMASNTDPAVVPNHAGNYWIGIWFPWWIAEPIFNTLYMYIDWVRITPFNEPNDLPATQCTTAPSQPGIIVGNTSVSGGSSQIYYVDNVPGATSYLWTLPSGWSGSSATNDNCQCRKFRWHSFRKISKCMWNKRCKKS